MVDLIIGSLLTALNAVLIFFLTRLHKRIDGQDERMVVMEHDLQDFRQNYIKRFEDATKERNENKQELTKMMNEVNLANEKSHAMIVDTIRTEIAKVNKR